MKIYQKEIDTRLKHSTKTAILKKSKIDLQNKTKGYTMANNKSYFRKHVSTVNGRVATASRNALTSDEIGYVKLFKGLINTDGDLSTKLETLVGGSLGVHGTPNKSNLYSSTDFPVIEGDKAISRSYSDGFMLISKVASQAGGYIASEKGAEEKLRNDVDALFLSHSMTDNDIFMGIGTDPQVVTAGIYGLGNSPEIGRSDNTLGKKFEVATAEEIYKELKAQVYDFMKNVNPIGVMQTVQTRKVDIILPTEIYLLIAMAEIVVGTETHTVMNALKKVFVNVGGVNFVDSPSMGQIQSLLKDDSKCAFIGYLDRYFMEARLPAPTAFMLGSGGSDSHVDHKTEYESLFASKNLGLRLKNISVIGADAKQAKRKIGRIVQGL